jgi:hypothetical protein
VSGLCISAKLRGSVIPNRVSTKLHLELLMALESARTRLAVAIASERKATLPDRLQYYMETAEQTRRFMKKLRRANSDIMQERQEWIHALENLRHLQVQDKAVGICQILRDIIVRLE